MAYQKGNGKHRLFTQGVELRGPLALSVTHREGGARLARRAGKSSTIKRVSDEEPDSTPVALAAPSLSGTSREFGLDDNASAETEIMERTLRLVNLLRNAQEVQAPVGVPCEGKIVSFDNALSFIRRYYRFLCDFGTEVATPKITFHWTAEENFQSIIESNLKVPSIEVGVKKKHGAAFGRGIYTCPDMKMAKEDFSYGASATFACLVLTGRQLTRNFSKGYGLMECQGVGFDSVVGKLPNRYVDTWVLPESDQVLPCFLIDDVASFVAIEKMREAIALIKEPWETPAESSQGVEPLAPTEMLVQSSEICPVPSAANIVPSSSGLSDPGTRWRRRCEGAADVVSPLVQKSIHNPVECRQVLSYGGDIQAAIPAEDRAALRVLLAARDVATRISSPDPSSSIRCELSDDMSPVSFAGRRWGAKGRLVQANSPGPLKDDVVQTGVVIKQGDLLAADEDFLVHQCNCVYSGCAQGIAESIFKTFPMADVYRQRRSQGRPHDTPGSVSVHGRIVNLYGQLLPGRPADDAPSGGWPGASRFVSEAQAAEDTRSARLRWFEACLAALPRSLPGTRSHRLAFPARIGCGLAGGHWPLYLAALERFSSAHPTLHIVVYDVEGRTEPAHYEADTDTRESAAINQDSNGLLSAKGKRSKSFWDSAVFEALREGVWEPYGPKDQAKLRACLRCEDDCNEAIALQERKSALVAMADADHSSQGFSTNLSPNASASAPTLSAILGASQVYLSALAVSAGFGEEKKLRDSQSEPVVAVRLRIPAVRDGELRLPADLDGSAIPAPRECGRLVKDTAERRAIQEANGCCAICLCDFSTGKAQSTPHIVQLVCSHPFHESCLLRWFEEYRRCPTCKRRYGHIVGNQPTVGTMSWKLDSSLRLPGFPDSFTIKLEFRFPPGVDAAGQHYRARTQHAYLPHNERGQLLLELFQVAFKRRVMFDLRTSATAGIYWPAFNIHLKTAVAGGPQQFGFPDDGYFVRVMQELRSNGVTVSDLT